MTPPPKRRKKQKAEGSQAFAAWVASKPLVATIPTVGREVVRFYLVRPGALMTKCPDCEGWFEISKGYDFTTSGPLTVQQDVHCPRCPTVFSVRAGVFRQE